MKTSRRALLTGGVLLASQPAFANSRAATNQRVFETVWRRVNREYYDPNFNGVDWNAARTAFASRAAAAPDGDALYSIVNEMLALLRDAHARALSPDVVRSRDRLRRRSVASGAGFEVRFADARGVVTAVRSGSPAERAGIQPGWIIDTINGQTFGPGVPKPDLPFDAVFVTAEDQAIVVRVEAADYAAPPQRVMRDLNGSRYLRFDSFEDPDIDWAEARATEMRSKPLVLDLRNNTGGRITQFERFIGCFFAQRVGYGTFRTRSDRPISLSFPGRNSHHGPLAVLIDRGSNSAAELFAAVIQAQGRGQVVGEATFGNVLGATESNLPDGGKLNLSIRDLVLASGRRLEGVGVTPDILAPRTLGDFRALRDPGLEEALEALQSPLPSSGGALPAAAL